MLGGAACQSIQRYSSEVISARWLAEIERLIVKRSRARITGEARTQSDS